MNDAGYLTGTGSLVSVISQRKMEPDQVGNSRFAVGYTSESLVVPETFSDPYPVYAALREHSPFRYPYVKAGSMPGVVEDVSSWALLRYQDVKDALRDHVSFSSHHPLTRTGAVPKLALLHDDPPRHDELRKLVAQAFSGNSLMLLEPWIRDTVNELLEKVAQTEVETMHSLAIPLPTMVAAKVLGLPTSEHRNYWKWSEHFLSVARMSKEERQASVQEMSRFIFKEISARREFPAEDLLTEIVCGRPGKELLKEEDMVSLCALVLIAGNSTTTNLIGNVLNIIADRPYLWDKLRANPYLVDNLIKETLRLDSPAQRLLRTATRDVELSGVRILQGDAVTIFFGSANRDPEFFDQPDEFLLDRSSPAHLAFGIGIHSCLGAALAQLEVRTLISTLLDRYSSIQRGAGAAVRQSKTSMLLGFERLPLRFVE